MACTIVEVRCGPAILGIPHREHLTIRHSLGARPIQLTVDSSFRMGRVRWNALATRCGEDALGGHASAGSRIADGYIPEFRATTLVPSDECCTPLLMCCSYPQPNHGGGSRMSDKTIPTQAMPDLRLGEETSESFIVRFHSDGRRYTQLSRRPHTSMHDDDDDADDARAWPLTCRHRSASWGSPFPSPLSGPRENVRGGNTVAYVRTPGTPIAPVDLLWVYQCQVAYR